MKDLIQYFVLRQDGNRIINYYRLKVNPNADSGSIPSLLTTNY